MDNRGQAHGIIAFFAMLTIGSLLFVMFSPGADAFFDAMLAQSSSQETADVINERKEIWGYILIWVVFVSGIFLIARSVLQSRSPG